MNEGVGPNQPEDREVRLFPQQRCPNKSSTHPVTLTVLKLKSYMEKQISAQRIWGLG